MNQKELDQSVAILKSHKEEWFHRISIQKRIEYLDEMIRLTHQVAPEQVKKAISAKQIPTDSPAVSEEWLGGPLVTLRTMRLLRDSLKEVARFGHPQLAKKQVRTRANGQVAVNVLPSSFYDSLLYSGFTAEVWMQPEVTPDRLFQNMAGFYQGQLQDPKVALILGAGNVASIAPLDAIHKLFQEGQVCLLKLNPVNDYLGEFLEESFAPLIRDGFVRICYGGGDVGAYLCEHEDIDEIHITGSDKTHDLIVFGAGEEGKKRKAENNPKCTKHISSELGNVSPIIVVPGEWKESELQFHAENVLTQMANNAGFNCNAAKMLILHEQWPQKTAFLERISALLQTHPSRMAYYPGAQERYQQFTEGKKTLKAEKVPTDHLPWTLVTGLDHKDTKSPYFTDESFCCVTGQTDISASSTLDFLQKAVSFCNNTLHGTLNACLIVHPKTEKMLGNSLEQAIEDLRYGSIAINHWPALSYGMGVTTWGAYPGHTLQDIQSGVGIVHNALMFDKPQKSVVYGPFTVFPKPPWFVTNHHATHLAEKLVDFEANPSPSQLPSIFWSALFG